VEHEDRAAAEALSAYLVDAVEPTDAMERFESTLGRLMEFALQREFARLEAEMRAVDATRDSASDDELFRKAAEVRRRLQELRASGQSGL
jgi:hypothetical protein